MTALTHDQLVAYVEKQRAEQGLPPRIEDVAVLTRIATIMRAAEPRTPVTPERPAGRKRRT